MEYVTELDPLEELPVQPAFSLPLFMLVFWLTSIATGMITWQILT